MVRIEPTFLKPTAKCAVIQTAFVWVPRPAAQSATPPASNSFRRRMNLGEPSLLLAFVCALSLLGRAMAIFRLSAKIISRAKGQSVIASAAYRAGDKLLDPNRLKDHDYTARRGIEHTEIMTPEKCPLWLQITPGNKQQEREILVALPHELDRKQRIEMVRDFVQRNFTDKGMVADVSFHAPEREDGRNYHAHILLTLREMTPQGFARTKNREWNDKALLQAWREDWAHTVNRGLERAGRPERVDHRSNEAQGLKREPQPKLGPVAHEIEKAGGQSKAGDDIRAVKERNLLREVWDLGNKALDAAVDRLDLAQHPLAQEAAVNRLERLLDDIADRLNPEIGLTGLTGQAADGAAKGLGKAADAALNVMGGMLSFLDPSPPPERRENVEERIAGLEALRDRLMKDEQDRARAQQLAAARAREEEHDRGRERTRDRRE